MYGVEINAVVPGQTYKVRVIDEKNKQVILDHEIQATSVEDAERFVIESFKNAFKND